MITHAEPRERLRDPRFHLIDVLPRDHYERLHLPGAINLPRLVRWMDAVRETARGIAT